MSFLKSLWYFSSGPCLTDKPEILGGNIYDVSADFTAENGNFNYLIILFYIHITPLGVWLTGRGFGSCSYFSDNVNCLTVHC